MNCEDIRRQLSAWLDGQMASDVIGKHVGSCRECGALAAKYKAADELLRAAARELAPVPPSAAAERIVRHVTGRRRGRWGRIFIRLAAAAAIAVTAATVYVNTRQAPPLDVTMYASSEATAGAPVPVRFQVRDHRTGGPVAGARVVGRAGQEVVEAESDSSGWVNISFTAPESAEEVVTRAEILSALGREEIEHRFAVRRPYKILISTDKPLYQPAQTVHLRVLAMNTLVQRPLAGQELSLVILDSNGNKVLRKTATTSEFGSAAFDFQLADEVLLGTYRIEASIRGVKSERTFEVKRYALPKFRVDLALDRKFYAPSQKISGSVAARYFFGKAVSNARVRVTGAAWRVDEFKTAFTAEGRTDADGRWTFEAELPDRFFGTELARGDADLRVEAEIVDGAEHAESKAVMATVSQDALKVWVIPEGGLRVSGAVMRLFVVTAYPDGELAKTTVAFGGREMECDGVVGVDVADPPEDFTVTARDERGVTARGGLVGTRKASFLIRPERYVARAGEPLGVAALAAFDEGTIHVDLVREGVTFVTKTIEVRHGRGETVIDLPAELAGAYQLSGYRIRSQGWIERDARTIVAESARGLVVEAKPALESYRPGQPVAVDIAVRDDQGRPAVSEVAVAVVDEAVFALHEARPGLEKGYFWIQEQLLTPRVQVKDCPPLVMPVSGVVLHRRMLELRGSMPLIEEGVEAQTAGYSIRQPEIEEFKENYNEILISAGLVLAALALLLGPPFLLFSLLRKSPLGIRLVTAGAAGALTIVLAAIVLLPAPLGGVRYVACGVEDLPRPSEGAAMAKGEAAPPYVRQFFPETLYWNPSVITDAQGRARIEFPGADSITTWRLTASAVSRGGSLGAADAGVKVFQEFFIDIDAPLVLTKGDVVWLPIACYNYLKEPQEIVVRLEASAGLYVDDAPEKRIALGPEGVGSVSFKVRALAFGKHALTAFGRAGAVEDAIRREIEVLPDAKEVPFSVSDRVNGTATLRLTVPQGAVGGAGSMWVALYPSAFSEIVSGLESLVRMPYG